MLGLYVHIPFCRSLCSYCDFTRGPFHEDVKRRYLAALEREIAAAADGQPADTIYLGGGTPSLLDPTEVARLLTVLRGSFAVVSDAEVTLEANPETVDAVRLEGYRDAGVNRLSLGVQSFRDPELVRLGRRHDSACARRAVAAARTAGFGNVSLDLMMWLPGQRPSDWQVSVESLLELQPDHASLYLLELYPQAPLHERAARAGWSQVPDDDAAAMYLWALERLEQAGYAQYEISNVARPGRHSRHNMKYWSDGEWRGFGSGAHSTAAGARWRNVAATEEYVALVRAGRSPAIDRREPDANERCQDALFTGLRRSEGVDLTAIGTRYGTDVWQTYGTPLAPYLEAGLVRRLADRLWLTRSGMLVANEVLSVFV